jgi:hypothetical protein
VFKARARSVRRPVAGPLAALTLLGLAVACSNYRDQLSRSQGYYEENQYELSLATLRHLESDQDSLSPADRVRYCYLRGMTDYRLEYRADARYWLGLARAAEPKAKGSLDPEELKRLTKALDELNAEVYSGKGTPAGGPAEGSSTAGQCQWSSECDAGLVCQGGKCVPAE